MGGLSLPGNHLTLAKLIFFTFMTDQNEEVPKINESLESVSLTDASAKKATERSDTDLEVEGECFLTSALTSLFLTIRTVHTNWYIFKMETKDTTLAES